MRRELRIKSGSTLERNHQQAQRNVRRDWDEILVSTCANTVFIVACQQFIWLNPIIED